MTPLRFRAWHDDWKEMLDPGFLQICGDGSISIYNDVESRWMSEDNDTYVMQNTGLKDKNGVEIFEGDIIKDKNGELRELIWFADNIKFYFKFVVNKGRGDDYVKGEECEVIGNIYENPDLLPSMK